MELKTWLNKNIRWLFSGVAVSVPLTFITIFLSSSGEENGVNQSGSNNIGSSFTNNEIHGDIIGRDKNVTIFQNPLDPRYTVEFNRSNYIVSGQSISFRVRSDPRKFLEDISCDWRISNNKSLDVVSAYDGCNGEITAHITSYDNAFVLGHELIKLSAVIVFDDSEYEAVSEIYVVPDHSSPDYKSLLTERTKAITDAVRGVKKSTHVSYDDHLKGFEVSVEVHGDKVRSRASAPMYSRTEEAAHLQQSFDGGENFTRSNHYSDYVGVGRSTQYVLRLVNNEGKELARTDATKKLFDAIQKEITRSVQLELSKEDRNGCGPFGCIFGVHDTGQYICSKLVRKVTVRQSDLGDWGELDRSFCSSPSAEPNYPKQVCYDFERMPFRLKIGQPLSVRLDYLNGKADEFLFPVTLKPHHVRYSRNMSKWVYLEPLNKEGSYDPAPAVLISFYPAEATVGGFRMVFGGGFCGNGSHEQSSELLIDEDGQGLVKLDSKRGIFGIVDDNTPSNDENKIDWLFQDKVVFGLGLDLGGRRIGPYWYELDATKVMNLAAEQERAPNVKCETSRNHRKKNQWVCYPSNRFSWLGVKEVKFGSSKNTFDYEYELVFTPQDYLNTGCDIYSGECEPFMFDVPLEWENIYHQITLKNGRELPVVRTKVSRF